MMNEIQLHKIDLNLLVVFEALMAERSVTAAAQRLGKTPSAISHALGRLRDQLGDPIMVKVGGAMQPSPYALALMDDVGPILRAIQRAVSPPSTFDPSTTRRVFRVAIPTFPGLMSRVYEKVNAQAPHAVLEWTAVRREALGPLGEGLIDVVMLGNTVAAPEGITKHPLPPLKVLTFARAGHPALSAWSLQAWMRWPHIMVDMGTRAANGVDLRCAELGLTRTIGANISDFGSIPPLLSHTDFLANSFYVAMGDAIDRYDLQILEPPLNDLSAQTALFWNTQLARTPELEWLRAIVLESFEALRQEAHTCVTEREILLPTRV
ncbi:MAG: LysR family transcriptional regulator [Pseudomonadota bacterium]